MRFVSVGKLRSSTFLFGIDIPIIDDVLDFGKDLLPGIIEGGASLIGGERAQDTSLQSTREQIAFQDAANQKMMDFQERMSSSAHQREVADLRLAGLNPILSSRLGGSSSPGGATSSGASFVASNVLGDAVSRGVASAQQARRLKADLEQIGAQTDNLEQDTKKKYSEYRLNDEKFRTEKIIQENIQQETANKTVDNAIMTEQLSSAKAAALRAKIDEAILETGLGKFVRTLGTYSKEISPFVSGVNSGASAASKVNTFVRR